jgi:hypothetical protein
VTLFKRFGHRKKDLEEILGKKLCRLASEKKSAKNPRTKYLLRNPEVTSCTAFNNTYSDSGLFGVRVLIFN